MINTVLLLVQPSGEANPLTMFGPLILIFIVFYFFIIRPQKKKEDDRKKMIEAVKKGDSVVTIGGIHGRVLKVEDTRVLVEIDSNVKVKVEKSAISGLTNKSASKSSTNIETIEN
ncbi:MAG: preprotein translocase subunit YajC [Rhodothermales bacterium]|nr:preprotein translocase subunit YajC [Rhodothermales bacterium]